MVGAEILRAETPMNRIRCAIYTRKSSEEGLEQEFNSLHAQREACTAYITSQKHEGWIVLPQSYDDGGISGGTLERPALRRLLADVDEGLVDQIVVYKIDRLTRSLADFAKLVERLDAAKASFVSVTQSFNTATSMGRLTLNVLLSFAQFEREVTAERIRDKIAASKRKGLWMGGNIPLGYEPDGRTLRIVEEEARTIRILYDLYLQHGTLLAVKEEARRRGLRSRPHDKSPNGKAFWIPDKQLATDLDGPREAMAGAARRPAPARNRQPLKTAPCRFVARKASTAAICSRVARSTTSSPIQFMLAASGITNRSMRDSIPPSSTRRHGIWSSKNCRKKQPASGAKPIPRQHLHRCWWASCSTRKAIA